MDALRGHQANDLAGDVQRHVVVDAPAREDHLRVVADLLRLVRQVVGIDADAVAADEAGPERQEVPLAARGLEHLLRVDAEPVEDHGELVDERDVDVALRVLDHLGRLGDADRRGRVRAGLDDRAVELVDELGRLRRRAGRDLADRRQPVLAVARVDALRAVAGVEVLVELESRLLFEDRHADLLGAAREHGGLVDHDVAALQDLAHRLAGALEWRQVRPLVGVDRRRHGDDVDAAGLEVPELRAEPQALRRGQLLRLDLERAVLAAAQLRDAIRVDVEADRVVALAELDRERQTDVTEAEHADAAVPQRQLGRLLTRHGRPPRGTGRARRRRGRSRRAPARGP